MFEFCSRGVVRLAGLGLVLGGVALATPVATWAATPPLVRVTYAPAQPQQGDVVTAFIDTSSFTSPAPVFVQLNGQLDSQSITLLHPQDTLWVAQLGPYSKSGQHTLQVQTLLFNKADYQTVRSQIAQVTQDLANAKNAAQFEKDPARLSALQSQISTDQSQLIQLQAQLQGLGTTVGTDQFSFSVRPNTDLNVLQHNIRLAQNRTLLIQDTDGGWQYNGTPDSHLNQSQASPANEFGVNAQGLIASYGVIQEPLVLTEAQKTASTFMSQVLNANNRLYSDDAEFLANASIVMGASSYMAQAQAALQAEMNFAAALVLLNTSSPDPTLVSGFTQAQFDAVPLAARVAAYDARLAGLTGGRDPGLRAYDWNTRLRRSFAVGDTVYAPAIAAQVALNFSTPPGISPQQPYYVTGLANTISALVPFQAQNPSYVAIVQQAMAQLLATQQPSGYFMASVAGANPDGNLEDQAFALKALLDAGQTQPMVPLLTAIYQAQLPWGGYDDGSGQEYVESQTELLAGLSAVWKADTASMLQAIALSAEDQECAIPTRSRQVPRGHVPPASPVH